MGRERGGEVGTATECFRDQGGVERELNVDNSTEQTCRMEEMFGEKEVEKKMERKLTEETGWRTGRETEREGGRERESE